jgi:leucyl aminopeptidase (aminopeptidase T)
MAVHKRKTNFDRAVTTLLVACMGLREGESCLVVCDPDRKGLGSILYEAARQITTTASLTVIQPPGPETWQHDTLVQLEKEMLSHDVILLLTGRSLSHTAPRRRAVKRGARLASMPGITKDILLRAARADYDDVSAKSKRLKDIFSAAETMSVETELGTEVTFSISGMEGYMEDGFYKRPGTWGNMPAGEACVGPREGTAQGLIVVDWSMSAVGRLQEPLLIRVEGGRAVEISGKQADRLLERLNPFGSSAFTVAEFGLGTNDCAQLSGIVLEDEKVLGTAHFALGNNISFGGSTDVPIHLDGVLRDPTITVDGKRIMQQGHLL